MSTAVDPTADAGGPAAAVDLVVRRFIGYLETGIADAGLFSDDIFLDFTLPQWRLQATGVVDVLALRHQGHPGPGRVPRWRSASVPGGFVIEFEERWHDDRGDWYCREMAWAALRGASICRLSVYCTGDWDGPRQTAHTQQVRLIEA